MFKEVKDKLVEILKGLEGEDEPLKKVFGYIEPSPQQFPCAMVRVSGTSTEIRLDTANNELTAEFTIRVLMVVTNDEADENQRLELLDAIMDEFRKSENVDTLGGICHRFDITSILQIETNEDQPVFGFDLVVQASKMQLIT